MDTNHSSKFSSHHHHHVVLFPFMSKGHTIPILHLARLLLRRGMAVTLFTTPGNRPFIAKSLADTSVSIIDIPYPQNVPEIPPGVESTDGLPSMELFDPFRGATKLMQPEFERELKGVVQVQPVSFMVSDVFLWWTLESATKFGFPRLVFSGMNQFASSVSTAVYEDKLFHGVESDDELITVTQFPWVKFTSNDFASSRPKPGASMELFFELLKSVINSYGYIVNSFYELEKCYIDRWNSTEGDPKVWCVGPLCLAEPEKPEPENKPSWIKWLDMKLDQGCSVLYVAFGTQAEISSDQLEQIAIGLQESKANFLWVLRTKESESSFDVEGFEERVKGRGMVVKQWVDQRQILKHKCVQGFLSHCGWNSALESICYGVPILAWPMLAEQPLNAKMVVEVIKVGLRVDSERNGMNPGFVKWESLMKTVNELMEGEMGKRVRKNVKEVAELAKIAMDDDNGGSSWKTLDLLIDELCHKK